MDKKEVVKLNIAMSYPVHWSFEKLMRDFVQNFYDAIGREDFSRKFHYCLEGNVLVLSANKGFDKEWLYYLGASTKRQGNGRYAGGFGEGFKIASLIAVRDYGVNITMESRDWTIRVTRTSGKIGQTDADFLAYEVGSREPEETSMLRLENVQDDASAAIKDALQSYYYEENSLFGPCLARSDDYAIFIAAQEKGKDTSGGYIFASYELRGFINVPLVICNHLYAPSEDDRDRMFLRDRQEEECVIQVFRRLDPKESFDVLEQLKPVWKGNTERYSSIDWQRLLRVLLTNIDYDHRVRNEFQAKYCGKLLIKTVSKGTCFPDEKLAYLWFQKSEYKKQFTYVSSVFSLLGVKTINQLFKESGSFQKDREPEEAEISQVKILEKTAQAILGDLICLPVWPEVRILLADKIPVRGYTEISKKSGKVNPYGLRVTAKASYIYLQADLFHPDRFANAFATYAHELLHQYGGDTSLPFHKALALMNRKIIDNIESFASFENEWRKKEY